MHYKILDTNGNPVEEPDVLKWARWYETADRVVAKDSVGDVDISTVFLGLDLYETVIFGGKHNQEAWRYATRADAEVGHKRAVELVKAST